MTEASTELVCANCGRRLDPTDKFCRECGLPTMRQAQRQKQVPVMPPDTSEMQRALNAAAPAPKPFVRVEPLPAPEAPAADTTGDVLKTTSPTQTTQMAAATLVMLVMIVIFAVMAIVFLVLALWL